MLGDAWDLKAGRPTQPRGGLRRLPGELGSAPGTPESKWKAGETRGARCRETPRGQAPTSGDTEMGAMEVQSGIERGQGDDEEQPGKWEGGRGRGVLPLGCGKPGGGKEFERRGQESC